MTELPPEEGPQVGASAASFGTPLLTDAPTGEWQPANHSLIAEFERRATVALIYLMTKRGEPLVITKAEYERSVVPASLTLSYDPLADQITVMLGAAIPDQVRGVVYERNTTVEVHEFVVPDEARPTLCAFVLSTGERCLMPQGASVHRKEGPE